MLQCETSTPTSLSSISQPISLCVTSSCPTNHCCRFSWRLSRRYDFPNKVCHGSQGDSIKLVSTSSPAPLLCPALHPPPPCVRAAILVETSETDWQALLIREVRKRGEEVGGEQWEKRGDTGTTGGGQKGECLRDREGGRLKVKKGGKGNVEYRLRGSFAMSLSLNCCAVCLTSLIPQKQTPPDVGLTPYPDELTPDKVKRWWWTSRCNNYTDKIRLCSSCTFKALFMFYVSEPDCGSDLWKVTLTVTSCTSIPLG